MKRDRHVRASGRIFAEIMVIVVGVLIALAVDNWSAQRAQDRAEQVYLKSLAEDVKQDIAQTDSAMTIIQRRQKRVRNALTVVQSEVLCKIRFA